MARKYYEVEEMERIECGDDYDDVEYELPKCHKCGANIQNSFDMIPVAKCGVCGEFVG